MESNINKQLIAQNTLLLYVRVLFTMGVSLFTSRVVLNTLGVEDFGIYNVVGGVVAMLAFLNSAMLASTQRYLTFELGKGDLKKLELVFMTSIYSHALISLIVVVTMETVGLWFMTTKMVIPEARMTAALWVFHLSVAMTVVSIMSTPYNAAIIAHEKMSAFAYISIVEAILKLAIVYLLFVGNFDKLILYAILLLIVQLIIRFIYSAYCTRHFEETRLRKLYNKNLFREMSVFAGWNLWGNLAGVFMSQGLNLLLNMFFGPVVNAARGVAVQVQAAVVQLAGNLQTAMNPQITKTYARGELNEMHGLVFRSAKFTFCLLLILSLPIMVEIDWILRLWLGAVPEHTNVFVILMLFYSIVNSMATPLMVSAAATGNVKLYQSIVGGTLLLTLPVAYAVLKLGGSPASVFVSELAVGIVAFVVRLYIIRPMIHLSLRQFAIQVITPCAIVAIVASIIPVAVRVILPNTVVIAIINCAISVISASLAVYFWGLTRHERNFVCNKVKSFAGKFFK